MSDDFSATIAGAAPPAAPTPSMKMRVGPPAAAAPGSALVPTLVLLGIALALLSLQLGLVGLGELHLYGLAHSLNDQAAYVDAARHFFEDGSVDTGAIYPSTLQQDYARRFLYMPGHPVAIGAAMRVLGSGPLAWLAPSVFGYLLSVLGVYAVARRRLPGAGALAAGVAVATAPPLLIYAGTAMAELTYLGACTLALVAFSALPAKWRPWLGALVLVPPFLVRELGAFYAAPFAIWLLMDGPAGRAARLRRAGVFSVLSVLLLGALYRLPALSSKPNLLLHNLFAPDGDAKYANAFAVPDVERGLGDWLGALAERAGANVGELFGVLTAEPLGFQALSLHLLLWPIVLAAVGWVRRPERRAIFAAHLALAAPTLLFVFLLYRWEGFIGLRQLLMLWPFAALTIGAWLEPLPWCRTRGPVAIGLATLVCAVAQLATTPAVTGQTEDAEVVRSFLRNVQPDRERTVVAPFPFGSVYLMEGRPARWSFVPQNLETLRLLDEREPIGTALLTDADVQRLGLENLQAMGLQPLGMQQFGELRILVLARPPAP